MIIQNIGKDLLYAVLLVLLHVTMVTRRIDIVQRWSMVYNETALRNPE